MTPGRDRGDASSSNGRFGRAPAALGRHPAQTVRWRLFNEDASPRPRSGVDSHVLSTETIANAGRFAPARVPEQRGPHPCVRHVSGVETRWSGLRRIAGLAAYFRASLMSHPDRTRQEALSAHRKRGRPCSMSPVVHRQRVDSQMVGPVWWSTGRKSTPLTTLLPSHVVYDPKALGECSIYAAEAVLPALPGSDDSATPQHSLRRPTTSRHKRPVHHLKALRTLCWTVPQWQAARGCGWPQ